MKSTPSREAMMGMAKASRILLVPQSKLKLSTKVTSRHFQYLRGAFLESYGSWRYQLHACFTSQFPTAALTNGRSGI